jgi:hypothetical protein
MAAIGAHTPTVPAAGPGRIGLGSYDHRPMRRRAAARCRRPAACLACKA